MTIFAYTFFWASASLGAGMWTNLLLCIIYEIPWEIYCVWQWPLLLRNIITETSRRGYVDSTGPVSHYANSLLSVTGDLLGPETCDKRIKCRLKWAEDSRIIKKDVISGALDKSSCKIILDLIKYDLFRSTLIFRSQKSHVMLLFIQTWVEYYAPLEACCLTSLVTCWEYYQCSNVPAGSSNT